MTPHSRFVRSGSLALVALTVVALGAVTGCSAEEKVRDKAETAGEGALEKAIADGEHGDDVEDVDVDAETGTITIKGKDGTLLIGEDLAMPEEFPSTLPLPEGGHSVNAVAAEQGVFEVTMLVTDTDLAAHEERIRAGLERADYEIEATETATVDGVAQRVVNGIGHGFEVAVRFSVALGKSAVHYSVKPQT
ncbi:hypothetical protein [Nocardioides gilvus]|uniref:hypothetical protein n=1 Tax=Nocardioides gilvus TaxID=1735589 RepID=UPI000D74309E|nr:hypothetical protein [Nocardioides gilvus]